MSQGVIDITALQKLKDMIGGDPEDLSELVEDFVSTLPVLVQQMTDYRAQEDWAALRISAHSCKSNAIDLGATELGSLCAELEGQCRAGRPIDPDAQLAEIRRAADAALTSLNEVDLVNV